MNSVRSSWIPGILSFLNLFCGFVSLLAASRQDVTQASWLIFLAMFWDTLDGNVARFLHSSSPLGRELDSLADVVSFVVAPSFFVLSHKNYALSLWGWLGIVAYLAAGVYRLARFNVGRPVKGYFRGLPTPAAAVFIVMAVVGIEKGGRLQPWFFNLALPALLLFVSFAMASRIPYPKISAVGFRRWNRVFYFCAIFFPTILFFINIETALTALFLTYIFLGPSQVHPRSVQARAEAFPIKIK